MKLRFSLLMLVCVAALVAAACGDDDGGPLDGGVLATFDVDGESFKVWTDDEDAMAQLVALEAGESDATIPNGWLDRGPGLDDHNAPWTWHIIPEDITLAESTIELCDVTPSYVEENLTEHMGESGRFCPNGAELTSLEDFR